MSSGRRTNDRRRRVLYSANQGETVRPTAASRREAERLREARRPIAAYTSRVHRRLRGRWFSLVPVRRRSLYVVAGIFMGVAVLLALAHHAAMTWPALANRPEVARPLLVHRPDSFARWFLCALMAGSAGASLMIYQLRRYRVDDYEGRYRLWRLVLVVMALASVNGLVSLVDWSGALLDTAFGKRVALTGSDWVHLVVSLGGAILALRLLAEVRRCRFALAMMSLTCLLLAIPEAVRWNVMQADGFGKSTIAITSPLLAFTSLFIALGAYLRMLYREVRQIEDSETLRERFQQMRLRVFQRDEEDELLESEPELEESAPKRSWWRRSRSSVVDESVEEEIEEAEQEEAAFEEEVAESNAEEEVAEDTPRRKRRWFGLRGPKPERDEVEAQAAEEEEPATELAAEESEQEDEPPRRKRRWFSRREKPESAEDESAQEEEPVATEESAEEDEQPKRRRFGLGWLGRRKADDSDQAESEAEAADAYEEGEESGPDYNADDEDYIDPDSIDWDSLSKAERRRLRKQIKRQRRAA